MKTFWCAKRTKVDLAMLVSLCIPCARQEYQNYLVAFFQVADRPVRQLENLGTVHKDYSTSGEIDSAKHRAEQGVYCLSFRTSQNRLAE